MCYLGQPELASDYKLLALYSFGKSSSMHELRAILPKLSLSGTNIFETISLACQDSTSPLMLPNTPLDTPPALAFLLLMVYTFCKSSHSDITTSSSSAVKAWNGSFAQLYKSVARTHTFVPNPACELHQDYRKRNNPECDPHSCIKHKKSINRLLPASASLPAMLSSADHVIPQAPNTVVINTINYPASCAHDLIIFCPMSHQTLHLDPVVWSNMPEDIIELICEALADYVIPTRRHHEPRRSGYCLVCKRWAQKCRGSLFRSLRLTSFEDIYRLDSILQSHAAVQLPTQIQELALEVPPCGNPYFQASAWRSLMRRLSRLNCVSISVEFERMSYTTRYPSSDLGPTSVGALGNVTMLALHNMRFRSLSSFVRYIDSLPNLKLLFLSSVTWKKSLQSPVCNERQSQVQTILAVDCRDAWRLGCLVAYSSLNAHKTWYLHPFQMDCARGTITVELFESHWRELTNLNPFLYENDKYIKGKQPPYIDYSCIHLAKYTCTQIDVP